MQRQHKCLYERLERQGKAVAIARHKHNKKGTTLVEVICTLALLSIFLSVSAFILSFAQKQYNSIQKINTAASLADSLLDDIDAQLKSAKGYIDLRIVDETSDVSVYPQAHINLTDTTEITHNIVGQLAEFKNNEGYVVLLGTPGYTTYILKKKVVTDYKTIPDGNLSVRYFSSADNKTMLNSISNEKYIYTLKTRYLTPEYSTSSTLQSSKHAPTSGSIINTSRGVFPCHPETYYQNFKAAINYTIPLDNFLDPVTNKYDLTRPVSYIKTSITLSDSLGAVTTKSAWTHFENEVIYDYTENCKPAI